MGNRSSFPGGKAAGREANHSHPSSAEVKESVELYLHSPKTPSWRDAQFKKTQGQLYFVPSLYCYFLWVESHTNVSVSYFTTSLTNTRIISYYRRCTPERLSLPVNYTH